jgi:hypothetical protein
MAGGLACLKASPLKGLRLVSAKRWSLLKGDLFARIESNIPTLSRNVLTYSLPMTSIAFPGKSPRPPKIVELPCVIVLAILAIYFEYNIIQHKHASSPKSTRPIIQVCSRRCPSLVDQLPLLPNRTFPLDHIYNLIRNPQRKLILSTPP